VDRAVSAPNVAELFRLHAEERTDPPPEPERPPSRFPNLDRALTGAAVLDAPAVPATVWGRGQRIAWASGQGFMITGHQGLGKTTIAQQLILHRLGIRTGSLFGLPVTPLPPEGRVLLLAMDRPSQALGSMRRMVGEEHRAELAARLVVWPGPLPFALLDDPLALAEFVHDVCPGVGDVVVDSVKDLAAGISKDEVGSALNTAWQEVLMTGAELLLLHHQRKAQNGQQRLNSLDDVYGSTWLTSGLGSVFGLDGTPGSPHVTVKHLKPVAEPLDDTPVRHDHASGTTERSSGVIPAHQSVKAFVRHAGPGGATAHDAAVAVLGVPIVLAAEDKRIRRELARLVREGNVTKTPGTRTKDGATPDVWVWTGAADLEAARQRAATAAIDAAGPECLDPPDTPPDTAPDDPETRRSEARATGHEPPDTGGAEEATGQPPDTRDRN